MVELHPNSKLAYQLVHDGTLALCRAEQQGIRVDLDYANSEKERLTKKIARLERKVKDTDFYREWEKSIGKEPNIYSNAQLSTFLYNVKRLKTTKMSSDEDSLKELGIAELDQLLEIRKIKKIRDTYLEAFVREQVNGVLHPAFHLHLVKTHRSSSSSPNFQNIPKRDKEAMQTVRKALFPRKGNQLLEVDYGGVEVKIAAAYHKDPMMLKYINDTTTDMHGDMASELFLIKDFDRSNPYHSLLRSAAKNGFVFPQFYGDYYKNNAISLACEWGGLPQKRWKPEQGVKISDDTFLSDHFISNGIRSLDAYIEHVRKIEDHFWNVRFRTYKKWKEKQWKTYQKNGYVDMFTGFRCSGLMGKNDCINYPVQGAAFHCLLWSFIEIDKWLLKSGKQSRMIGQIHDAIIFDIHPSELSEVATKVQKIMCEDLPKAWKWINVPLEVDADICDVDCSWAEKKHYEFC